jgi:hypothetical protein
VRLPAAQRPRRGVRRVAHSSAAAKMRRGSPPTPRRPAGRSGPWRPGRGRALPARRHRSDGRWTWQPLHVTLT